MKNITDSNKPSFFKKIFIKLCRKFGYEIIDQNTFEIITTNKKLNEELSLIGQKSINLPLGEVKITRKIEALDTPKKLKEKFKAANMNDVFLKLARG